MDGSVPMFRLTARGGDGLCCDRRGIALGPVALVEAGNANGRRVYRLRPAEGLIFWVYAFFTTAWPFAATLTIARRYGIQKPLYYLGCGAIAGFLLSLIVVVPPWVHNLEPDNTFIAEWIRIGRAFAVCGACGGLAFWYKAGRFISRRDAQGETPPSRT